MGRYDAYSSSVRILDCRSHTWRDAPSMNVPRKNPMSCFYDGKVYVMGGCGISKHASYAEVFDTKTQSWECLPDPDGDIRYRLLMYSILEIEGKIHLGSGYNSFAYYDTKQCKWENDNVTLPYSECLMDNVSYSFKKHGSRYNLWWRDLNGGDSKEVKGLNSLGNRFKRHGGSSDTTPNLASCDGKLYLMWEGYMKKNNPNNMMKILCAKIWIEKRDGDEIWGNIEWFDVVHTAPTTCHIVHCLAISV